MNSNANGCRILLMGLLLGLLSFPFRLASAEPADSVWRREGKVGPGGVVLSLAAAYLLSIDALNVGTLPQPRLFLQMRRTADGSLLWSIPESSAGSRPGIFSPDSREVAVRTGRSWEIRSVADGRLLQTVATGWASSESNADGPAKFSPDGSLFAEFNLDTHSTNLWRVSDGALLRSYPNVSIFAFSLDGASFVTFTPVSSDEKLGDYEKVEVWKVADGSPVRSYSLYCNAPLFSETDDRFLCDTNGLKVWNLLTGRLIRSVSLADAPPQVPGVTRLGASPDLEKIYVVYPDIQTGIGVYV